MIKVVKIKLRKAMNRQDEIEKNIKITITEGNSQLFCELFTKYLLDMIDKDLVIYKTDTITDAETGQADELWFELGGNHELLMNELNQRAQHMVAAGMIIPSQG